MKEIVSMIGVEAEFLLFNAKGELIVPPASWDRDAYPVLGEIRGEPGKTPREVLVNFFSKRMEVEAALRKGHSMKFMDVCRVPLKIYKEANRQVNAADKESGMSDVRNIYGTDITDFTDQIVEKGKIQGIRISCGLHIHFSCEMTDEVEVEEDQYKAVRLPIDWAIAKGVGEDEAHAITEMVNPSIYLYSKEGYTKKKTLIARASQLNKPTIVRFVTELDKAFFGRFAPAAKERTKYRQPGFWEPKPYGFEYRSLPCNDAALLALPEIVEFAFELMRDARII